MKAADITDADFIEAVRAVRELRPHAMTSRWDVGAILSGNIDYVREMGSADAGLAPYPPMPEFTIPQKVVLAKAKRLVNRGAISGCACGCRGDFELPEWTAGPART